MGIIKISDTTHDNVRLASLAFDRSINAQAEHWLKIGMLLELHPDKTYSEISQLLLQQSIDSGSAHLPLNRALPNAVAGTSEAQ